MQSAVSRLRTLCVPGVNTADAIAVSAPSSALGANTRESEPRGPILVFEVLGGTAFENSL
jgi:hypothetical protein